jgi:signal transduction histidine kinase
VWNAYQDLRRDLITSAEGLGRTLSRALIPAMLRDEVWQAYETIITPFDLPRDLQSDDKVIVVLDNGHRVYVSSHPRLFPTLAPLTHIDGRYAPVVGRNRTERPAETFALQEAIPGHILVVVPIVTEDDSRLGTVLLSYSESLFGPRFRAILQQVLLSTGMVLAVLLPIGWYAGNRMVIPLLQLAEAVRRLGHEPPSHIGAQLYEGGDEIGQLGRQFRRMLSEMAEKHALQKEVIAGDRLAAIGRLTSGIAHEINNPLGGMLNAINTRRRHGAPDALTERTLSLLERGLVQIKSTVGALLVEARIESRALTRADVDDIRTLVLHQASERRVRLIWQNELPARIELPSAPVRQVLINLLLNAVQAAGRDGYAACRVGVEKGKLLVEVSNDGKSLSPAQMERLFEPFASESGTGLGLWVSYQIVQQLGGVIRADSAGGTTQFVVVLPVE